MSIVSVLAWSVGLLVVSMAYQFAALLLEIQRDV